MNYDNGTMKVGALEVGFRLEGRAPRHLVLLHGRNSHSGTWRKNFPALAGENTVFAPSLPTSDGVSATLVERYAGYVAEMAGRLGMEEADVVGNSMGGWVAIRLVLMKPKTFRRLILEDTAGAESGDAKALGRAGVPVLVVWGGRDTLLPLSVGEGLHARLPGSEFRVVRHAGHVPHWDAPDEFNALVTEFLSTRSRSA